MQVESDSPAVHLRRSLDYCQERGHEVNEVHQLDGVSGGAIWDLPAAQKMRYNIETGKAQGLVFTALDRLGRDTLELLQFERFFRDHGACLISIFDNIDTSTSDGMRYFQGLAAQAEYERRKLSERVTRGILTRQKRGEIRTKKAPFGYQKNNKSLVPHPIEAPIVRLAFELYKEHASLSEVARALNEQGFSTSESSPFTANNIRRILTNSAVVGNYYANRLAMGNKVKPKDQWVKIEVPALVSAEDWEQVQAILKMHSKPKRRTIYAYSGLVVCGCGERMYTRKDSGIKYFCRACCNKILASDLDMAVGEAVKSFSLDKMPAGIRVDYSIEFTAKSALLSSVTASIQKAQKEIDKLFELFTNDAINLAEFKSKKPHLEQRKQELEDQKSALEFELTEKQGEKRAEKAIKAVLTELKWNQMPDAQKNELLKAFVKDITISDATIELQLLYVPRSLNPTIVQ